MGWHGRHTKCSWSRHMKYKPENDVCWYSCNTRIASPLATKHGGGKSSKQTFSRQAQQTVICRYACLRERGNERVMKQKHEDSLFQLRLFRSLRCERDFFLLWGGVVDPTARKKDGMGHGRTGVARADEMMCHRGYASNASESGVWSSKGNRQQATAATAAQHTAT